MSSLLIAKEQGMRFSGRTAVTTIGQMEGREMAIAAAKGIMQGAIDELITILGEKEAYAIAQARVDQICRPTEDQLKAWAPRS